MSCSKCNCNPCQCHCSCDPQNEALSSAFANFELNFIGVFTKTCVNGEVVWELPCDLSSEFTGFPRGTDEPVFCYMWRAIQDALNASGAITLPLAVNQGGTGATTAGGALTNLGAQAACANLDLWCLKDPPSGTVVGTTDSQTLSNKTVTNPDNTRQVLADGATVNWDMSLGGCALLVIAGNRTIAAPTNLKVGTYVLEVTQSGGGNTLTWNAIFKWASGTAPTLSAGAGARDVISFYCNGTNLVGAAILNVS